MKKCRLNELPNSEDGHILCDFMEHDTIDYGNIGIFKKGDRTHANDGLDGIDYHVHQNLTEAFIVLQGRGSIEVDGVLHSVKSGDVVIVYPGEDHHIVADQEGKFIVAWLKII